MSASRSRLLEQSRRLVEGYGDDGSDDEGRDADGDQVDDGDDCEHEGAEPHLVEPVDQCREESDYVRGGEVGACAVDCVGGELVGVGVCVVGGVLVCVVVDALSDVAGEAGE